MGGWPCTGSAPELVQAVLGYPSSKRKGALHAKSGRLTESSTSMKRPPPGGLFFAPGTCSTETSMGWAAALLRKEPQAPRFFGAYAQSALGTGAGYVAIVLVAYERFHSPLAISLILLA